jgi:hypothetical protein
VLRGHRVNQSANSDACKEDNEVKLAAQQRIGKSQRIGIGREGNLAHTRHKKRLSAISADEFGNLDGTTGLERKYAQSPEVRMSQMHSPKRCTNLVRF